jgi:hypothetical protein
MTQFNLFLNFFKLISESKSQNQQQQHQQKKCHNCITLDYVPPTCLFIQIKLKNVS